SLNNPNMMLDLRVPKNQQYEQVIVDQVLSSFIAGEYKSSADAASDLYDKWEALTNQLGRDTQKTAYIATLGVQK
ncbi:MAG TPA: hypothetical protein VKQ72_21340, partial [Aggregatilineales bacterium]|nr:hypothetical protein [Aggregatilineales bacterium]